MSEHLLVFPDRETADEVAGELEEQGYADVRVVREALAGEDDSEAHEWAVLVVVEGGLGAGTGVGQRLAVVAEERGGWYDGAPAG